MIRHILLLALLLFPAYGKATTEANIDLVINEIYRTYGDRVKIDRKTLVKFGRATDIDTDQREIVGLNQNETYVSTNAIDSISSSNGSDTVTIAYEGMTISGSEFTFFADTVTVSGQTRVALPTAAARVTRAYVLGTTEPAGNIYIYENTALTSGVPTDITKAHNLITAGENQSLRAATSVAKNNYFIMINIYAYMNKATNGTANIKLRTRSLDGVFRTKFVGAISNSQELEHVYHPYMIVPPNTDISMTANGSTNNLDVSAGFQGFFADIMTDEEWNNYRSLGID